MRLQRIQPYTLRGGWAWGLCCRRQASMESAVGRWREKLRCIELPMCDTLPTRRCKLALIWGRDGVKTRSGKTGGARKRAWRRHDG